MSFSAFVNKWIFQFAHIGWGALIAMWSGLVTGHSLLGLFITVAFAAGKEFIFDPLTETPSLSGGRKGDAIDFVFWCLGGLLGMGLLRLAVYIVIRSL